MHAQCEDRDKEFAHDFHVVGFTSQKVIMGFDILRDNELIPIPSEGKLKTSPSTHVQCYTLKKAKNEGDVVKIRKLDSSAYTPQPSSEHDPGFELKSPTTITIPQGERRLKLLLDSRSEIPYHRFGATYSKNGALLQGIEIGTGVITSDYQGEVGVVVINVIGQ